MLAFSNDYYGFIFRATQSVELFCAYPGSDCALNALAIDEPLEYARLYLDGTMQMWVDAEDSLEI